MKRSRTHDDRAVQQLLAVQRRLRAYLLAVLNDAELADECLQETNLVLWRKRDERSTGVDFALWAIGVARLQAMALRKKQSRDRLQLGNQAIERIVNHLGTGPDDQHIEALRACLNTLPDRHFRAVRLYYGGQRRIGDLASAMSLAPAAAKSLLHRARRQLTECLRYRLAAEGA